jgi:hypothetical protein
MTRTQAFASHIGCDVSETKDYRYHYGRTSLPVWSIDGNYYCVTKVGAKPSNHRDKMDFGWVKLEDNFCENQGFIIWISKN